MAGNEINLTIKVTDKGNLKIVGQNAEKAAAGLDKTGKSARTADRNLKGAAQASANGSKNFSKMAQGISGGLVPAYATLAAQIFAVSAAFNFLKDAGQLGLLQSGQTAYAAATGISLKSLTEDIQAATEAQLGFRDAAQAAAIGVAAGLDPTQITQVAKAAKDASTVLGRDLTDSFNRLTRGITKAEPELLDELGIILRLDTATQKYADALGRSKDSLTAFERSQAVANEVLTQAEEKYGKVLAVTGGGANEFAKLSTAFEDIVNNLRKFAVDFLTPIATTLQEMPALIFAAFAPFGAQVFKTALPGLEKVSGALDNMATRAESASEKAQKSLKESLKDDELVKGSAILQQALQKEVQANAQARLADVQANKNSLLQKLKDGKQLSNAQIVQVRKNLEAEARGYKIKDKEIKASLHRTLNEMERSNRLTTKKMELHFKTLSFSVQKSFVNIKTSAAGLFASLVRGAQAAGAGISMALSAISWIGLIASLGALAVSFFRSGKEAENAGPKYDYLESKVETLTAETEEFIAVQNILNDTFEYGNKTIEAYGKRLSNTSTQKLGDTLRGSKELIAIQKEITGVIEQAQKDLPGAQTATDQATQRTTSVGRRGGGRGGAFAFVASQKIELDLQEELIEVRKKATMGLQDYIETKKEELTPAENALKILLDDKKALEGLTNERFQASTVVNAYKTSLDALAKGQEVDIDLLLKQRTAVEELAAEISELTRLQTENSRAIATAEARVLPLSEYDQLLVNMNQELRLLQDIALQYEKNKTGQQLTETEKKRLQFLKDRKSLIESLANLEFKIAKNTLATDTALITASRGKTKLVKDGIRLEADIVKSKIKEFELSEKIRQATKLIGEDAQAVKEAQAARNRGETLTREQQTLLDTNVARERSIELAAAELGLTREKTTELELQKDTLFQLQQAALQAFETSVQSNLASLIKGDESSLKDAMLSIAQSTLSAVADTLAQQMTQGLMESLFGIMSPEERIKQKMLEAAEEHGRIVESAVRGESITPLGEIQKTAMSNESSTTPERKSLMEKLFGAPSQREVPQEGADVKIVGNRGGSVNRFLGDFAAIFDKQAGNGGFLEKLGNVFASGGDIFKDIFSSLPDLLGGLFGGAGGGGILSFLGFANGGIAKGGFRTAAYATGGIAKSPTIGLVGEGKYNEAIVPLPDGKSIPVSMGRGMGQQNNVTVNVSIDGNGVASQNMNGDSQGMDLGRVIAGAVQQELLNQKRQGGILNPNGVA